MIQQDQHCEVAMKFELFHNMKYHYEFKLCNTCMKYHYEFKLCNTCMNYMYELIRIYLNVHIP
jgi:hypothetical protein